ncbi:MAG: anhydro-N-acetylmuramic acid kinase [Rhodospirillales bacterium]|nr:anhydro-N-acetylmuramic acid kinase [Rhodospirillales bacterium]MBO6785851.1 anhydro-N-acetylmuramic acid kinase [Rhodospirillales bacterium]
MPDNDLKGGNPPQAGHVLTAIGLMSGTSMDGIDVAVIDTDGETVKRRGAFASYPYEASLRKKVQAIAGHKLERGDALSAVVRDITDAHAEAVEDFLGRAGLSPHDVDVVGFHGQTVFHDPANGVTVQLGDGARLAERLRITVVNDFRSADVAAGGEGAPFAPLYHAALARPLEPPVCVLNLGGVGNLTWISPDGGIIAFDTGPANALLDDWVLANTGQAMDADGAISRAGTVNDDVLAELLENDYFDQPYPKSLDRDHFDPSPVMGLSLEDGAATLVAFSAEAVGRAQAMLPALPERWLVTGGGRHNPVMMAALRSALDRPVEPVEAAGWSGDAMEAQAFAYLAVRSLYGLPLSLPSTTGVTEPMPGGVLHRP